MGGAPLRLIFAAFLSLTVYAMPVAAAAPSPESAATATDQRPPLGRLPDTLRPRLYRLDLTIDPNRERFSGRAEIDTDLRQSTRHIWLHGRDLAVQRAVATAGGRTFVGKWRQAHPTGVTLLTFSDPLPAGAVTFSFTYDAPFNDTPSGLYRVKVGDKWHSWTQFQSIDARAAFPSFDEPGFKTPFVVTLRTRPGHMAISNAPEVASERDGEWQVHRFAPTLPLPTYLVAFVVGPFVAVESPVPPTAQRREPLPLRIVATPPNAAKLDFALKGSQEIVKLLETYFADAFPFPKLDQIASPIMPGAMENAGADIYRDSLLVLDDRAPVSQQRSFGMVVAHELAHQWFGDLVTPAWWDDIWLNESFANWMGYRIGNEWRPDLNIAAGALAEGFAAMSTDALVAGRPIRQRIETSDQIDAAFDSITYGKGGHVVAMIAAYMGDERFRDGVRRYMKAHRYGNATSADFFAAMAEAAGDPRVLPAMQSFTDQQGVPLVTFEGGPLRYKVTQSRYAELGAAPPDTRWGIPLCVRRVEARGCGLMTEKTINLTVEGDGPLMPNAGGTGYYRFELPKRDWNALIERADRLPGGEAQALSDSLEASFAAGRATFGQLVTLTRKLTRNPDSYASAGAFDPLISLASAGIIAEPAMAGLQRFVRRLNAPLIKEFGLDLRAGAYAREPAERSERRLSAVRRIAGLGRDAEMAGKLSRAARAYLGGSRQELDPVWFTLSFDAHVREGGLPQATGLVDAALASEDPLFRPAALSAVASSGKADVARWLLEDLKDTRLRTSERRGLLAGVMSREATREIGYRWLTANLDSLLSGGGIFFTSRLPQMLRGYCSLDKADVIARDLRPRLKGTPGELELERTIERVRGCAALKQARQAEVSAAAAALK